MLIQLTQNLVRIRSNFDILWSFTAFLDPNGSRTFPSINHLFLVPLAAFPFITSPVILQTQINKQTPGKTSLAEVTTNTLRLFTRSLRKRWPSQWSRGRTVRVTVLCWVHQNASLPTCYAASCWAPAADQPDSKRVLHSSAGEKGSHCVTGWLCNRHTLNLTGVRGGAEPALLSSQVWPEGRATSRIKGRTEGWVGCERGMTACYPGENAQSSLHFHFSSNVLAAHELQECTAGQPVVQADSIPIPCASSHVSTCPSLSNSSYVSSASLYKTGRRPLTIN